MGPKVNKSPTELKALGLLQYFKQALGEKRGEKRIAFLPRANPRKLLKPLEWLIGHFSTAETAYKAALKQYAHKRKKTKNERPSLADYLNWHEVHKQGRELWTELMRAAISNIDPGAKGHSQLLDYLKAATEFEDLLYGLEPFYRDHTLHSLWVYLIGIKLMGTTGELKEIAKRLNWYVYNDVPEHKYPQPLVSWARLTEKYLNEEIQKKKDAIWCIIALCHDLGYSLAKLRHLNEKVQAVLKFYDVPDFRHVGYMLDLEHQYLVKQVLDLMAMDVRITPGSDYPQEVSKKQEKDLGKCIELAAQKSREQFEKNKKHRDLRGLLMAAVRTWYRESADKKAAGSNGRKTLDLAGKAYDNVLTKCFRDDSSYWRLGKALERKEHGILSAYLLYKTVGLFADTSVRSPAEGWGLDDDEAVDNIIRGDILFAIAQHEFEFAHISQMSSLAEILILCDELEEFSRLGRQLQSRKYHDTTAETAVEITLRENKEKPDPINTEVDIAMTYDSRHQERADFAKFCWRKARRLCRFFSLGTDTPQEKAYRINEIKTTFKYRDKPGDGKPDYKLIFTMNKKHRGVTIQMNDLKPVKLECRDDDVFVAGDPDNSLKKWLKNKKQLKIEEKDWPESE